MTECREKIIIHTDGAARGNPGPGGYGIILKYGNYRKEFAQGYKRTTNNRMELLAVIVALELLKHGGSSVVVYTDSKYVSEAVNQKWIFEWERKGFKKRKNPDLWKRFLKVFRKHEIEVIWIKGHAYNEENIRCDKMAVNASKQPDLLVDEGYNKDQETLF